MALRLTGQEFSLVSPQGGACPCPALRERLGVAAPAARCVGALLFGEPLWGLWASGPEDTSLLLPVSSEKSLERELTASILDIEDLVRSGNKHR